MKYRRILLAYNGSKEGRRALLECADLAGFLKAETHLLAVASMPPSLFLTEGFVPEELLEEEKKRTQSVLDEGTRKLREGGFNATGHLAVGEPVEEICRLAKALRTDLIVRSEEHTSELQSPCNLVCRLLLEKKKTTHTTSPNTIFTSRRCILPPLAAPTNIPPTAWIPPRPLPPQQTVDDTTSPGASTEQHDS